MIKFKDLKPFIIILIILSMLFMFSLMSFIIDMTTSITIMHPFYTLITTIELFGFIIVTITSIKDIINTANNIKEIK